MKMKKQFSYFVVMSVIVGLVFSLVGAVMVSQNVLAKNNQIAYSQSARPVFSAGMQIVKKAFLHQELEKTRGKPSSPPGQNKDKDDNDWTATGVLGSSVSGDKYAVVIGVCDYPGTANDLCASDGDSLNMHKALVELYGYADENIYLFRDTNPSTTSDTIPTDGPALFSAIEDAVLNQIKPNVSPEDEVVFFFSGHGGWLRDEYGNPIDVEPYDETDGVDEVIVVHNGSEAVGISDDLLVSWFSDFQTSRITFIFDTCLAGGMNDLADEEESENGRVIVMATEENKYAYVYSTGGSDIDGDGIQDGEGVFSRLFVNQGMLQNMADGFNQLQTLDSNVAVEESFDYARRNIPPRLKQRQKPVISDGFIDDLLL